MKRLNKYPSFRIVFIYAVVSAIYIYSSDYFLEILTSDVILLTKLQTLKGLLFIVITALLLYSLVKQNLDKMTDYYQEIIDVKQQLITQSIHAKEEYSFLFDHSPLPMFLFDIETLGFLNVNETACSMYGYSKEEFLKMTLPDIRPAEDIPIMEELLNDSLKDDISPLSKLIRHQKKNGEIFLVKVKTSYVKFENKKVRLVSVIDLTSEVTIQNELLETNSKLQAASDIAGLGYWSNDLLKSEIQWSDEVYKIFEVDRETFELNLDNIKELFHPEDELIDDPQFYENLKDRTITESERRIITPHGQLKWLLERVYIIRDAQGHPIKFQGIALDITKRKLHEQEIRESNERFKLLAKATIEAVIDWDIENRTTFWGEGFQTMLGYYLTMCDNHFWQRNIHPADRKRVLKDLKKALAKPETQFFDAEYQFFRANGSIAYMQHKGILIRNASGKAIRAIGAMIDMTETLDRMQKIESQNKALKDIAWTQSHVVRRPLANMMGIISLLKNNFEIDKESENLLEYITISAEELDKIIREIVKKTSEINNL